MSCTPTARRRILRQLDETALVGPPRAAFLRRQKQPRFSGPCASRRSWSAVAPERLRGRNIIAGRKISMMRALRRSDFSSPVVSPSSAASTWAAVPKQVRDLITFPQEMLVEVRRTHRDACYRAHRLGSVRRGSASTPSYFLRAPQNCLPPLESRSERRNSRDKLARSFWRDSFFGFQHLSNPLFLKPATTFWGFSVKGLRHEMPKRPSGHNEGSQADDPVITAFSNLPTFSFRKRRRPPLRLARNGVKTCRNVFWN